MDMCCRFLAEWRVHFYSAFALKLHLGALGSSQTMGADESAPKLKSKSPNAQLA